MAKSTPQSTTRRDLVSNEIIERAAALFAERGVASTSLQDVAEALQISRTALYHYISSKDQLLETLVRGITAPTADDLERLARDSTLDPLARLDAAIRGMAGRIATNPARFRLLVASEGALPEALAAEHREARRRTLEHLTEIIRAGVKTGVLRPVNERVAAFALLGMCNWIAQWYRPDRDGEQTPEEIAAELADLGTASLRADASSPRGSGDSVDHALSTLRRDLRHLERTIDAAREQAPSKGG